MKILRIALFIALFGSLCTANSTAQNTDNKANLVLDKYTIPLNEKGASIGKFISPTDGLIVLSEDASGLFEIKGNNELALKKNKAINNDSQISYIISVKDGDQEKKFNIVKDEFVNNKVIAHRGAWKHHDKSHNSLGAVSEAMNLGCQAAEIDVWLTKDRQIVLCHDMDLDGRIVEKTNLDDLKSIKLKHDESAPTLEEVLDLIMSQNKMRLVIELKSNGSNSNVIALADSVVDLVNRKNAQAWVDYISFDYRGLKAIKEKDATAHLSLLEPSVALDLQKLDGMSGVDYYHTLFDKKDRLMERCAALGLTTNAWTVNDEETMAKLLDLDIDMITTDEPEMLLNVIESRKQ